jgi:hypothetical protein
MGFLEQPRTVTDGGNISLTPETGVRNPYGAPIISSTYLAGPHQVQLLCPAIGYDT